MDIFFKFINPIKENIKEQSNRYAIHKHKMFNLQGNELLITINFCMGYIILPSYKYYRSSVKVLNVPAISKVMIIYRFVEILSNMHVNNNDNIPQNNKHKLFKLRPIIDILTQIFFEAYIGTSELSVDESMIKFKGHGTLK